MCWNSICIDNDRIKTMPKVHCLSTTKDIVVYKIGYLSDNNFIPYYYIEYYYKPNSLNYEIKLNICDFNNIEEGYHSYSEDCYKLKGNNVIEVYPADDGFELPVIERYYDYRNPYNKFIIGKFIIPKSNEYYENEHGEIVSSNIFWTGEYHLISNIKCDNKAQFKDLKYVLDDK